MTPRVDPSMFGVNIDGLWNYSWEWSPAARATQFAAIAGAGIHTVRAGVVWNEVQSCKPGSLGCAGTFDWRRHDDWMAALARAGLDADLQLGWSADWASSYMGKQLARPADTDAFVAYARAVAGRYGRNGEFWREHRDLPYHPVTLFELWNEENESAWWNPQPDPAAYADLYLATKRALSDIDPRAALIVGGLAAASTSTRDVEADTRFLHDMFADRPALHGHVDGVGYHPYATSKDDVLARVASVRRELRTLGEGSVPLYLTELGWAAGGGPHAMTESARAALLYDTFDTLARSDCGIRRIDAYTWVSPEQNQQDDPDWMGLYNSDGSPKPSGNALQHLVDVLGGRGPAPAPPGPTHVC